MGKVDGRLDLKKSVISNRGGIVESGWVRGLAKAEGFAFPISKE
jgi:hypothetical protein